MANASVLSCESPGIKLWGTSVGCRKVSLLKGNFSLYKFRTSRNDNEITLRRLPNVHRLCLIHRHPRKMCILASGRNYQPSYNDDSGVEPFWVNQIREAIWAIRALLLFLVEQPSQLRYIEWPSFQRTFKTATLTLVLVALLIVTLASVDSALSYLLALVLRRKT